MHDDLFRVVVATGTASATIALSGELDFSNANVLYKALDGVPAIPETIFDLSGLGFIDSSGLTAIATYARRVLPAGRVIVVAPQRSMRRLFSITSLDTILTIVEDAPT